MASTTPQQLVTIQLGAATTSVYAVPANRRLIITKVTLLNTTGTDRTADLYLVPSGGSADGTNRILNGKVLEANMTEPYTVSGAMPHVLNGLGEIHAGASAATAITMIVSGILVVTG
jgi:hypothetical protein